MVTEEQITLYAIGAMDPREAAEFERQIAASPDAVQLRKRIAEEKAALVALLTQAESITPSPSLKSKLMARVDADIASAAPVQPVSPRPVTASKPAQIQQQQPATRTNLGDIWRYLFGGLSVGFAALALVFGLNWMNAQSQLASVQSQLTAAQSNTAEATAELQRANARVAELEGNLAQARADVAAANTALASAQTSAEQAQAEVAAAQNRIAQTETQLTNVLGEIAVLNQSDVRISALPSIKNGYEQGNVRVFYSPDGKTALFIVSNLPKLSADKDYQVWLIKDKLPLPSSVFDTNDNGTVRFIVESDEPFSAFQNLGITVEPAGGRPTPNPEGPVYLGPID
jgi:anti-sigma-K factor RskA